MACQQKCCVCFQFVFYMSDVCSGVCGSMRRKSSRIVNGIYGKKLRMGLFCCFHFFLVSAKKLRDFVVWKDAKKIHHRHRRHCSQLDNEIHCRGRQAGSAAVGGGENPCNYFRIIAKYLWSIYGWFVFEFYVISRCFEFGAFLGVFLSLSLLLLLFYC